MSGTTEDDLVVPTHGLSEIDIKAELGRLLASRQFSASQRLSSFLTYIVERTLAGDLESLKESVIGAEVFDRKLGYDPKTEPIVRTEALRLRTKLQEYYEHRPRESSVMIAVPRGRYVAEFTSVRRVVAMHPGIELLPRPPGAGRPPVAGAAVPAEPIETLAPLESWPAHLPAQETRLRSSLSEAESRPSRRKRGWPALTTAAVVCLAATVLLWWRSPLREPPRTFGGPVTRFTIHLQPDQEVLPDLGRNLALSPNGQLLAYVFRKNGIFRLSVAKLETGESRILPDSEDAHAPAFSPDGEKIAAYVDGHIRQFLLYGPASDLAKAAPNFFLPGLVWNSNSTVLFNSSPDHDQNKAPSIVWRAAAGERPVEVTPVERTIAGDQSLMVQQKLPGQSGWLVSGRAAPPHERYLALVTTRGEKKLLLEDAIGGFYLPSGHLVFYRGGSLWAAPFDLANQKIAGSELPVLGGVSLAGWQGPDAAISENGTLAYVPGLPSLPDRTLLWVDLQGHETPVGLPPGPYNPLDISPDGKKLLFSRFDSLQQTWTLWSYGLRDRTSRQLAGPSPDVIVGCWSAEGKQVIFGSKQHDVGTGEILIKAFEGPPQSDERQLTAHANFGHFPQSVSRDGRWVAYVYGTLPGKKSDIWTLDMADPAHAVARALVESPDWDVNPAISPDGRWIAYASSAPGTAQLFLKRFPESGHAMQLTTEGGVAPLWSPDGKVLYYRSGTRMMALPVVPKPGRPRELFRGAYLEPDHWQRYGLLAPDGRHFILAQVGTLARQQTIQVVVNWQAELYSMLHPAVH